MQIYKLFFNVVLLYAEKFYFLTFFKEKRAISCKFLRFLAIFATIFASKKQKADAHLVSTHPPHLL